MAAWCTPAILGSQTMYGPRGDEPEQPWCRKIQPPHVYTSGSYEVDSESFTIFRCVQLSSGILLQNIIHVSKYSHHMLTCHHGTMDETPPTSCKHLEPSNQVCLCRHQFVKQPNLKRLSEKTVHVRMPGRWRACGKIEYNACS